MTNLDSILKSRDITLSTKVHVVKAMVFPVTMYGCESWTRKKAECRRIDAFELWCWRRLLRVPWTARRSNHPEGDQFWVFIGRTDVEAETPILWPPDAKSWLIGKDPNAGKDWGREEKGTTKDEMIGWHHRLSGHGFGWTLGVGDGQGGLVCCSSWGRKERLNWLTDWPSWRLQVLGNNSSPGLMVEDSNHQKARSLTNWQVEASCGFPSGRKYYHHDSKGCCLAISRFCPEMVGVLRNTMANGLGAPAPIQIFCWGADLDYPNKAWL